MNTVANAEYEPTTEEVMPPPMDITPVVALPEAPSYDDDLRRVMAARRHPDNFETLLNHSSGLIAVVVDKYFLQGGTRDDLLQEAMFEFYKCVGKYDGVSSSFTTYATTCIDRCLQNVIRDSNAQKHRLLNHSVSFDYDPEDGASSEKHRSLDEQLEDSLADPEKTAEQRQFLGKVLDTITDGLTPVESVCVKLHRLSDANHEQIAETLGIEAKEVNNALRRARRKMPDFDDVTTSLL